MAYPRPEIPGRYVPSTPDHSSSGAGGAGRGPYPRVAHPVGSNPTPAPPAVAARGANFVHSADIPIRVYVRSEFHITPMAIAPLPPVPPPRSRAQLEFDLERDFVTQLERAAMQGGPRGAGQGRPSSPKDAAAAAGDRAEGPVSGLGDPGGRTGVRGGGVNGMDGRDAAALAELGLQDNSSSPFARLRPSSDHASPAGSCEPGPLSPPEVFPEAAQYMAMGLERQAVILGIAMHGNNQTKVVDFCTVFSRLSEMRFAPERLAGALALYDNNLDKALEHLASGL